MQGFGKVVLFVLLYLLYRCRARQVAAVTVFTVFRSRGSPMLGVGKGEEKEGMKICGSRYDWVRGRMEIVIVIGQ